MIQRSITALSLACALGAIVSCQSEAEHPQQELVVKNLSESPLTEKAIAVKREALKEIPEGSMFPLLITAEGDTLAAQLDDLDGDRQWDELFFVTDLPAKGERVFNLSWQASQPEFTKRTSIRFGKRSSGNSTVEPKTSDTLLAKQLPKSLGYQPYQTDGPSWENDKVGFRQYFDGRNAKDLFGKKVSYMSPENVGLNADGAVEDNYHVMEEWGRDILAVGNSMGIGGIALLAGDSLARLGVTVEDSINNIERSTFNIVTEGPVRSMMDFTYENWKPLDHSYTLEERTSIWPGMYAFQNTVELSDLQGNESLLVGLVNSRTDKELVEVPVNEEWVALMTHDKQTYEKDWWLGMALILPREAYQGYLEAPESGRLSSSYFGKLKVENNQPLQYYAVAGWELADPNFSDSTYFANYVQNLAKQLTAEVAVEVK